MSGKDGIVEAAKVALFATLVAAPFLAAHFIAGAYAEPKTPAEECGKPNSPPGSRAGLLLDLSG